jgi:hypothetical protein
VHVSGTHEDLPKDVFARPCVSNPALFIALELNQHGVGSYERCAAGLRSSILRSGVEILQQVESQQTSCATVHTTAMRRKLRSLTAKSHQAVLDILVLMSHSKHMLRLQEPIR